MVKKLLKINEVPPKIIQKKVVFVLESFPMRYSTIILDYVNRYTSSFVFPFHSESVYKKIVLLQWKQNAN